MKLYVGNLAHQTDENSLREAFEKHGEIEEVRIVIDRDTGRSRGFGFATYQDSNDARKAIDEMNGYELDGHSIVVNEARERGSDGGGGGRGRYGGGGGGYRGGGGGHR